MHGSIYSMWDLTGGCIKRMAGIAAFLNVDVFACRTTGPVSLSMELRSPWSIPCPYTPWKHCTFVCIKCSLRYGIFGWMFLPSAVSCCWDNLRDGRANQFMTYSMGESWSRGGGTHIYWQYVYVRPTRGPFHALPAVPKDIFFTDQPVQGPFYPFLRYTVEQNLKFSGFIARSWANKSVESRS